MNDKCYGKMFPDLNELQYKKKYSGKVFSAKINHQPIAITSREIYVDDKQWQKCLKCDSFTSCYNLSMAKLNLISAIKK